MSERLRAAAVAIVCTLAGPGRAAWAEVDLAWAPPSQSVAVGAAVQIGLLAVSDNGADQTISAMDVVFTWDPAVLRFEGIVNNGPYAWFMSSFPADDGLDGLNNSLVDGDAKYTALGNFSSPAVATPGGTLVTTFRFTALAPAELTHVVIEPFLGQYSITRVFGADFPNQDVTGELGEAAVTVVVPATVTASDLALPAGRTGYVVVWGGIDGDPTYGVTVMLEISPESGSTGAVTFTPSPPVDILQLDDPWPGAGWFTSYDTDLTRSVALNGSVDDNGLFEPEPFSYSGALAVFPVVASADADGLWEVSPETAVGSSSWQGVVTALTRGTIRIVSLGDCDGSGWIDLLDFSRFQACFTGSVGPLDPPGYPFVADACCGVFDFDEDGDVDLVDYADFRAVMSGPGP